MANNRMYLLCEGCGEVFGIAKHFGADWNVYDRLKTSALDEWLSEHRWCPEEGIDGAHFRAVYENDPTGRAELPDNATHPHPVA